MKRMIALLSNRFVIAGIAFGLGIGGTLMTQEFLEGDESLQRIVETEDQFERIWKPFGVDSPDDWMLSPRSSFLPPDLDSFQSSLSLDVSTPELQTREDDQFVYYEIPLDGAAMENFDVKVEHGQVMISGEVEKRDESATFSSSFHRSVPAPSNTDAEKVTIENGENKIVLKFPKLAV